MEPLLVDSHCHLDRLDPEAVGGDLDHALAQAREHGVGHFLCVCINLANLPTLLGFARDYANITCSVGVHPNDAVGDSAPGVEQLVALADDPRIVAIGETGLDYYRSTGDLEWQRQRFRHHIRAARETGKPLIIHSRAARDDTLAVMREEQAGKAGGIMHCFVEDWEMAQACMDMGFYISFSGIVTFKNATELQGVAQKVPSERLLVETDSPYLAPMPYRGKPNQPAYVRYVAEKLAVLREERLETVAEVTTGNFFTLFPNARQ